MAKALNQPHWLIRGIRTFLTRGRWFFILHGFLYLRHPRLTQKVRAVIRSKGLGELAHGDAFLRIPAIGDVSKRPEKSELLVLGFGRFGNMIIQLGNLSILSSGLGISSIHFWESPHLPPKLLLPSGAQLNVATLMPRQGGTHPPLIFRTRAFSAPLFPQSMSRVESETLRAALRAARSPEPPRGDAEIADRLVIHLRSGDVFWPNPHPAYGQPPLGFYQLVLNYREWSEVVLVAEDETNPCFEEILDLCREKNTPTRITGRNFSDAILEVSRAQNVVFSAGTFCPAICWLEPLNRTVFHFADSPTQSFELDGANFVLVKDKNGRYVSSVMDGNWANTPEQRKLMVEYPKSALTLHEDGV